MGFCIKPVSNSFSNTRPNGSANRAADHGAHRTTHTGSNSRTSLSPSPATGGRDRSYRSYRRWPGNTIGPRSPVGLTVALVVGAVLRLPLGLLPTTPTPLLMPLRIHPPRQPHRNQTQHRHRQRHQPRHTKDQGDRVIAIKASRLGQQQQPSKYQKTSHRRLGVRGVSRTGGVFLPVSR